MTGALDLEYRAALSATRRDDLRPLLAAGVSWATIAAVMPAIARITVTGSTYQPDPDASSSAFLIPVRTASALGPESADPSETVRFAAIVDLLAFHPAHPRRWALRRAAAGWLGAIAPQYLDPDPVSVWRSPLDWLRASGVGLVLLSIEPSAAYRVLSGCGGDIVAEDAQHAAELRALLARPWLGPRIVIRQVRRAG